MTDSPPPTASASPVAVPGAASAALPWYRRPLFWGVLLFLVLLAYALWLVWLQWAAFQLQKPAMVRAVKEQQARNTLWEAESARLREALTQDPCLAQRALEQDVTPATLLGTPPVLNPNLKDTPTLGEDAKLPPSPPQAALPPENTADLLEQATVLVLAKGARGLSMGTGFFIAPGIILTNEHVTGQNPEQIWVLNKATGGLLEATLRVSSSSKGQDYAVLQVAATPSIVPLSFAPTVRRTDRVSAWGFPNAVTADDPKFQALLQGKSQASPEVVYTDGVVSVILNRKPPLIVHTATVSQGNSGGPLINTQGQVVGINTYIRLDEESYRQSSLAIMGPDVMAFLKSHNIPFTLATEVPAPKVKSENTPPKADTAPTETKPAAAPKSDTAPVTATPAKPNSTQGKD